MCRNIVYPCFAWVILLLLVNVSPVSAVVRDIDGNTYRTVDINGMTWMAENLSVRHYRNGDPIRHAASDAEWASAERNKEGAWCYYRNDTANGSLYGKLYNYYAVRDPRGLAPAGWRIPDDRDWENLADFYGGKIYAAKHLKSASHWQNACPGTTNKSGFSALPGGYRRIDAVFLYAGQIGLFWSSSKFVNGYAWFRNMNCRNAVLFRNDTNMGNGLSVRCVR